MLQLIVRCAALVFLTPLLMGQNIAVTDCTLIDPRTGAATAHSNIVIVGDRIAARGPVASTRIPAGARIVRGSGKFVIPGFWDMHVHVCEIEEDWFPLYLANGLTGLREMAALGSIDESTNYEQNRDQAYHSEVLAAVQISGIRVLGMNARLLRRITRTPCSA